MSDAPPNNSQPTNGQITLPRNKYVARRVLARMQSRGEAMTLRRISMLAGPEPYANPANVTDDVTVTAATVIGGQAYLNLTASTATGRLIAGDQITSTSFDPVATPCTVVGMPNTVMTNSDGIPQVDETGAPVLGAPPPAVYNADALAWNNQFPVVPVSFAGDVTTLINTVVDIVFAADLQVYGTVLTYEQMVKMGWIEVDTIGLSLAAYLIDPPPKVNDIIIVNDEKRSILQTGRRFSNGVNFLFPVQVR
jgi:hypothetical protein